jgi:general nucleoside transport system permease protein
MSLASIAEYSGPLLAAAGGSLAAEKSGRTNMALEGLVTVGAFVAAASGVSGIPPIAGAALAALLGTALALAFCVFLEKTGADPVISGIAFNLLSAASVSALAEAISGSAGLWRFGAPSGAMIPFASLLAGLAFFALSWILIARTRAGLRLRAAGSSPEALQAAGADPEGGRRLAFAVSGCGAALAGALMALGIGAFSPGLSAGRGWLALASVYAGRKGASGTLAAVAAFSGANYIATIAQSSFPLPLELSACIPPLVALIAVTLSGLRAGGGGGRRP